MYNNSTQVMRSSNDKTSYSGSVTEVLSSGLSFTSNLATGLIEDAMLDSSEADTFEIDWKVTYTDSTAVSSDTVTEVHVTLQDVDNTVLGPSGPACKTCHAPIPVTPSVNIFLDKVFGSFMFQDGAAPARSVFPTSASISRVVFASLIQQEQTNQRFSDVPVGSEAQAAIGVLARAGMVTGYPDNSFQPGGALTRAQLMLMVVKALNLPLGVGPTSFLDLAPNDPIGAYAAAAATSGLLIPTLPPNTFGPNDLVSREEAAFVIATAFRVPPPGGISSTFVPPSTDYQQIDSWALGSVAAVIAVGYLPNFSDGTFRPKDPITRAQSALTLVSALSPTGSEFVKNPLPVLTSVSPSNAVPGGNAVTLTVTGANFLPGSVVRWNDVDKATQFVNSTTLMASIPASDVATAGWVPITVFNPAPGGGVSDALTFVIGVTTTYNPVPTLSSIAPATALGGAPAFTLTLNGSNFIPGSRVFWNGSYRATTFVSGSRLMASILASDISDVGPASVMVFTPVPGGGTSNVMTFTISGPVNNPSGTVNGASFAPGVAVAPGSIASDFGSGFPAANYQAVKLRLDGFPAFVFGVSSGQINFQVPWELAGQSQGTLAVSVGGATSIPGTVGLATYSPGIFSTDSSGRGQGAVLLAGTAFVAAASGTFPGARPVTRGDFISIFCTGLGPVTNQPKSGGPASSDPLSVTTATPTVTIGAVEAPVVFSGLAPYFVGLYQINAQVPASAPTGDAVPLALNIGGLNSNTVTIAVQ